MRKVTQILVLLFVVFIISGCNEEEKLAQWRGPDRNGIFPETGLLDSWSADSLEILWTFKGLGKGYAGPVISPHGIFINAEEKGKSYTVALDLDGEFLWKSPNGEEFLGEGFSSTYPGARSTPTVKGDLVYATSGMGHLTCFDAMTGETAWSIDLIKDLGGLLGYFGYSESVAVDDEKVYCFPGGLENNLVALDKENGKLLWSSSLKQDTFAYGSPVLIDLPKLEVLMFSSRHFISIVDRNNGELLSDYELEGYEYDGEHCNTPVFTNGHIFFVANDIPGQGSMRLKLSADGKEIQELWRNNEVLNNFGGFVVIDDHIFTTIKGNKLVSLHPDDGRIVDSLKVASGSIVFADNKFFCYGYSGAVELVNYRDGSLSSGGKIRVKAGSGQHFSHPVLADGVMYIRRGDALIAYRVGG